MSRTYTVGPLEKIKLEKNIQNQSIDRMSEALADYQSEMNSIELSLFPIGYVEISPYAWCHYCGEAESADDMIWDNELPFDSQECINLFKGETKS